MESRTFMKRVSIKDALAGKTFGEKVEYLWTYYKWVLLVIAIGAGLISTVATGIRNRNTETLYSGMLVNTDISEEGTQFLTDDFFAYLGGNEKKQNMVLTSTYFRNSENSDPEMDSVAVMRLMASVLAGDLDYTLLNDVAYEAYQDQLLFTALGEVLPAQLLEQYAEQIVYFTDTEQGITYPQAINISDWAFVQDCVQPNGAVYLAFCNKSDAMADNETFIAYLQGWK